MSVSNLYPGGDDPVTVNLGLSLWGMDFVVAENFITLDAAVGSGSSSVKVNGSVIANPNFGSLPAAPVGDTNVIFQVDSSGNVSAYVPIPASAGVVSFNGRTGIVTSVIGDYAAFYDALGAAAAAAAASLPRSLMTTAGDMIYENAKHTAARLPIGTAGQVLTVVAGLPAWATPASSGGTVTSFSAGNIDSIVTSSVATATTTPALTFSLSTQTANTVWAGPVSGGVATPTFRALVTADIPSLSTVYLPLTGGVLSGNLTLDSTLTDGSASAGTSGQLLSSTGSKVAWVNAPSSGVTSFTGDGVVLSNSVSTGAVTATLESIPANEVLAGPTSGTNHTPTFRALVSADIPNNAANTSGTAANLSGTPALPNGTTATTQTPGDTTTKLATDAFVAAAITAAGGVTSITGDGVVMSNSASTGAVTLTLETFAAHAVLAGPATGSTPATPTARLLVAADIPAITEPLSSLTNATAALTLNNATFSSTFNQNAGDIWTWGLPSYTAAVSNSPTLELAGSYQSGTGTFAKDFWTVINTPTVGTTNGVDKLIFTHSGTTGTAYVTLPNLQFSASSSFIDINSNGWAINFTQESGAGSAFMVAGGAGVGGQIRTAAQGMPFQFSGNYTTQTAGSLASFGNSSSFTGTSGTVIGVEIGSNSGANGVTTALAYTVAPASGSLTFIGCKIDPTFTPTTSSGGLQGLNVSPTFNPTAGSSTFVGVNIAPTVEGTSSGATTVLLVNPTNTLTNLSGTNLLADFQNAGTTQASIDYSGFYYSKGVKGITQSAEAVGTIATTGGIVTTFTAVSDERLKKFSSYEEGLETINGISPIKFRWNETGSKISGQSTERDFIGFSAQNVQKMIPEAVHVTRDGWLGFDDRPVICAAVNAIKELYAIIKAQGDRIKELEAKH